MTTHTTPDSELFDKQLRYAGRAKAEFSDPAGFVEGPVQIRFNERGETAVEMTVENVETKEPLELGLMELFSASGAIRDGNTIGVGIGGGQNICTKLSAHWDQAEFVATDGLSLFHYFEMKMVTPYLRQLIIESSKPLSDIETVFAVDSTGFSIKSLGSWIDTRFEKDKVRGKRAWIKVHIMCGVLTNIITAVEISKGTAGDSPYLKLLYKVTALHFCIKEVLGDKAYSSLENLRLVSNNGGILFCPFKINAKAEHRTKDPLWAMLYHLFSMYPEWFKRHYHKRSNVESTFSAIKRKFGEFLRSRTETAQVNEALCKVLCHNLCVINQCMYQMELEPMFWKEEKIDRAKAS